MKSPLYRPYNLRIIANPSCVDVLTQLFNSEDWKLTEERRNKLCKICTTKGDHTSIQKKIDTDDRKLAMMHLDKLRVLEIAYSSAHNVRMINLNANNKEFINSPENEEAYIKYQQNLNIAMFLADALHSALLDARSELKKIDPDIVLSEFNQLSPVISAVGDLNSYSRKDMPDELKAFYSDKLDELNEVIFDNAIEFIGEYNELKNKIK